MSTSNVHNEQDGNISPMRPEVETSQNMETGAREASSFNRGILPPCGAIPPTCHWVQVRDMHLPTRRRVQVWDMQRRMTDGDLGSDTTVAPSRLR